MNVRGMGTAISTTCNWGANLIIGSTFLSLIDRITAAGAFGASLKVTSCRVDRLLTSVR